MARKCVHVVILLAVSLPKTLTLQAFLDFARAKYSNLRVEIATMSFPLARFLFGVAEVWYALPIRSGRYPKP